MHYNGDNSYHFVKGREIHKFITKEYDKKDGEIEICLGNISTDFNADKTGRYRNVHDFSIDLTPVAVSNILDIHKYLMKKTTI